MFILTKFFCLLTATLIQPAGITQKNTLFSCDKTSTFFVNKIVHLKSNTEESAGFEITISPSAGIINIKIDHPLKGKAAFNTTITSADCTLNTTLTGGEATYKGYIVQPDGSRSTSTIHIKAASDKIIITESDPLTGRQPAYCMMVDKWLTTE